MNQDHHKIEKYNSYDIYDFLEDREFRNFVLLDSASDESWRRIVAEYSSESGDSAFDKARSILLNLRAHFENNGLTDLEIRARIDQRINTYRAQTTKHNKKLRTRRLVWRAAAAVLILIGMAWLLQWNNRPTVMYETGNGERIVVELPDASVVHLNGNSKLIWNRHWEDSKVRKVFLEGEGYFDVAKVDGMPFDVVTDDVTIEVLGTVFNVNNRRQKTKVFLEEGKINLKINEKPEESLMLEPGDEVEYNAGDENLIKYKLEEGNEKITWKDGLLIYREEPLLEVMKEVADIYGKEFMFVDSTLLDRKITSTIPLTDWEMSATAIQMAMRLEFKEKNDTIRIKEKD